MPRSRLVLTVAALLALVAVPAGGAAATARTKITVYAASSLTNAFPALAPHERYSFGGSNALAAQIQQGAPADVFASANMTLPRQLHQNGLCSKPVAFARNRLVIVVPRNNPASIHSIYNLTKSGVKVDIAAKGVPVGDYTQQVLQNMALTDAVMKNVVSQETDVREVLSKVVLGEVDAGFVYSTDARTVAAKVLVVKIPAWAQPKVQYGICVVSSSAHKAAARAFVKRVRSTAGERTLHRFGFLPRVKS